MLLWAFMERFEQRGPGGRVTWIDVHTGLGGSGKDTLMVGGPAEVAEVEKCFPGADEVQGDGSGDSDVGAGYELTRGLCEELFRYGWLAFLMWISFLAGSRGMRPARCRGAEVLPCMLGTVLPCMLGTVLRPSCHRSSDILFILNR